jgi:hypothetical protein
MADRNTSAAYRALRASARRLLLFIETEVARGGGHAKIFDDQFAVVGSRRVVRPGLRELDELGLIEHERHPKHSICRLSQRWREINSRRDARAISAAAREQQRKIAAVAEDAAPGP